MNKLSYSNRNYWLLSAALVKRCSFGNSSNMINFERSVSSGLEHDRKKQRWSSGIGTGSNALTLNKKTDQFVMSDASASASDPKKPAQEEEEDEEGMTEYEKRIKNVGRCLKYYLKKREAHEEMMQKEREEFEMGKRHLANIMGWDPQLSVSQEQIDKAIQYLFPSSLHDNKALPVMKPPDVILPKFKKLDFDEEGRPLDAFFYTARPKYSRLLSEINDRTQQLVQEYDQKVLQGQDPDTLNNKKAKLLGSQWIDAEKMRLKLGGEKVTDEMHANFVLAMNFLAEQQLSSEMLKFLNSWREGSSGSTGKGPKIFKAMLPQINRDKISNRLCTLLTTRAKKCYVTVKVLKDGTGKFTVNGKDFGDFRSMLAREILLCPLIVTGLLGKLDIECKAKEDKDKDLGEIVLPRAIRHGVALGIASMFRDKLDMLRVSGLLTLDLRKAERSKINQPGARKKWLWKRR